MAKVTGPLYSMGASGKIGNAMVFFGWKGVNCVRQWLIPANPKSEGQGDNRLILGGTGRAVGSIDNGSGFHQKMIDKEVIPSGQTKQSFGVSKLINTYLSSVSDFETEHGNYESHTAKSDFDGVADDLGIGDLTIDYAGTEKSYEGGFGVYMLARLGISLGFTGDPYDTDLSSWTDTEIDQLKSELQN